MDQDVRCPNCGTTKYANANLRIMVNACGHGLCESCVDLLFAKGAGKCPTCGVTLKRHSYRVQLYDDENVEKDLEIRRRLLKEINLKEEDFDSLRDYNDYLEKFETFVYNLANNIDVNETNENIKSFKQQHSDKLTKKQRSKVSKDYLLIEEILEEEREAKNNRNFNVPNDNFLAAKKIAARKENLLDDLLTSDLPAEMILKSFQRQTEKEIAAISENEAKLQKQLADSLAAKRKQKLTFSSGIRLGSDTTFDAEMANAEAVPYVYKVPKIPNDGPACPTPRTIVRGNYLNHTRQPSQADIAGGFSALYPCQRALQEAIIDLTFITV